MTTTAAAAKATVAAKATPTMGQVIVIDKGRPGKSPTNDIYPWVSSLLFHILGDESPP